MENGLKSIFEKEDEWKTLEERPGYFGKKMDETFKQYDSQYGKSSWRIAWKWGNMVINYPMACQLYEDSYYADSFKREDLWKKLVKEAKEVYDTEVSNINSGFDYMKQEGKATHIQDISIRLVVFRRGWKFEGEELIQIRNHDNYWGSNLSPGKVKFHLPEMIVVPHLEGWWNNDSIEDFYQSNKILQIKAKS